MVCLQDTVTHHSDLSTPQDTQQFYKIVPQDHPGGQYSQPSQDENSTSKDFYHFHNNGARRDHQHFDTVKESQELQQFQGNTQPSGECHEQEGHKPSGEGHHQHQYHGGQGSQSVEHQPQETVSRHQDVGKQGVQDLHQEVGRQVQDLHQEVGRQTQDPQQFRIQLEEMIAARHEHDQRADFRKEVVEIHSGKKLKCCDSTIRKLIVKRVNHSFIQLKAYSEFSLQVEERVEQASEQTAVT